MQEKIKDAVLRAKEKPALYGPDIDLDQYDAKVQEHPYMEDLCELAAGERDAMESAGLNISGDGRSGTW